jgi:hypothetical protein
MNHRRVIVLQGALAACALAAFGAVIYSMQSAGASHGWSHTWSHSYPNGLVVWTGYRLIPPPHREHPLAAAAVWLCAVTVALLTLRFWVLTRPTGGAATPGD